MRILFLAPHLSTGGMPQFLLKRLESLKDYTDNEYYVVEYQCHSLDFVVQRNAIKSLLLENFTTLYEDKMELFKIINEWQPDIIHIDEPSERLDREMVKRLYNPERKYRIVETCHDISFDPNSKLFHPDLYSFCTPYHEKTFADLESKYVTILYPIEEMNLTKFKTIWQNELGFDKNKKHVLNVGLWTPGKNQAEGIEIARKYPEFIFHFVGNQAGNFKDYWQPLMRDLPPNVKIWGERTDIDHFMIASDIFMFNSTWECNPLVLREAIGYGIPIIARNLPQYCDMYHQYINPIDRDLNLVIKETYEIPTDETSLKFAYNHKKAYEKLLELPIQKQKVIINQHFVDAPFLEIKGISDSDFKVQFLDEKGTLYYENTIKSNCWVKLNRQYFTKWTTKVWQDGHLIYKNTLNLANKTVFIVLDSKSLGDTIAWSGYALEFQKKHNCHVVMSTFWNKILDYPELELVEPGTTVNCYALYRIGWKWDENKEPVLCNTIPLQQAATNILGLEFKEIKPKLKFDGYHKTGKKSVVIATNSTMECKFWTKEGWQKVINYLCQNRYDVINVSKEDNPFENCTKIHDTSIEYTMQVINNADLFIGLSSGLSWLAWALNQKVVMISNFTESDHEFDCYRVTKPDVCNSCWNDPNIRLDPFWDWCPRNKNFECQRSISASMVINKIKEAGF
jgi:autotransporter strand-loop-strand O-heptosyltransferase